MKISCHFIDNIIPDDYSKLASVQVKGSAVVSFPFTIEEIPSGAKSLAWTLVDYDSIPVCGFAYIHWVVANVPAEKAHIEADFSRNDKYHLKGKNSLVSRFLTKDYSDIDDAYMGPYPPDKDHVYTLTVYALDADLDLSKGFYMNELLHKIKGHILAESKLEVIGKC